MSEKQIAALVVLICAIILLGHQQSSQASRFESWKTDHGISFPSQLENAYREKVFLENLAKIETHNARSDRTYEKGLNKFSALTQEEFAETYLMPHVPENYRSIQIAEDTVSLGNDVDWVAQGAVTPVKEQGQCRASWAFASVASLEGLSKIAYGTLQTFSEQQLLDCSDSYGNAGCSSGSMNNAFRYVRDKGIAEEKEYPYKGFKQTCSKDGGVFKISWFAEANTTCNSLAI
jgi:C1A family cysteine protease